MVWGSNPGKDKIFHTCPDQPWGPCPTSGTVGAKPFPGIKWPWHAINHPPPSTAKARQRVELYLYFPSVPS